MALDPEKKKKFMITMVLSGAGVLMLILLMIAGAAKDREAGPEEPQNQYSDIQDAELDKGAETMMESYMMSEGGGTGRASNDYWDSLSDSVAEPEQDSGSQAGSGTADVMSEMMSSSKPQAKPRSGGSMPPLEGSPRQEQPSRKAATEPKPETVSAAAEPEEPEAVPETEAQPVRKSSNINSFDNNWGYIGGTDNAISSFDDESEFVSTDTYAPVKCMFLREEKLKSGQKVTLRLLEDMVVDGVLVAQNTHLSATCNITTRLELSISSIEIKGKILPMNYEAYDTDGARGIYCPDITEVSRAAQRRGLSTTGSILGGVGLGRIATDVVNTGVSLVETSTGVKTVTVPSGYTFYLMKKLNN